MLIVGSRNSGYEGTFRVGAYSSVTSLVSWIPIIGWIASLYGIYLAIMGIGRFTTPARVRRRSWSSYAVVLFLLALLIIAAVGAALFFGTQQ